MSEEIVEVGLPCKIITPQKTAFDAEIRTLTVETAGGTIELMPRHEPLMTPLEVGIAEIEKWDRRGEGKHEFTFIIHGGFLEMNGKEVTILASAAEDVADVDVERAQASITRAKERLDAIARKTEEAENLDMDRAKLALIRATMRMQATELKR